MAKVRILLVLVFIAAIVSMTLMSCAPSGDKPSGISASAQVIGVHANTLNCQDFERLVVELKPTSSTQANKEYVLGLYEKGTLRDSTIFTWSQAKVNVKDTLDVLFPLTDDEYEAYRVWTNNGPLPRDLRDIFTIAIAEPVDVETILTRPSILGTGLKEFDVVVGLAPSESTQPLTIYVVKLVWKTDNGYEKSLAATVSWSQSQLDSRQVRNTGMGTFSEKETSLFLGGGSEDFWQSHYYRVTVLIHELT